MPGPIKVQKIKINYLLLLIFILAAIVRFAYFPDNIHFSYDQARDSFTSLEILKGDLKMVGPPSFANDKLFPGPLIFYIYAPIYLLFDRNPEFASIFFRFYNALGVFLAAYIGKILFNRHVGYLAAFLFAVSYEQSQYSLFLSHQALAVITVLLFYFGLAILLFKKNKKGLLVSTLGAGLSIQSHYLYFILIVIGVIILIILRKTVPKLTSKLLFSSILIFLLTISTYILAEIKFNFRFASGILSLFSNMAGSGSTNYFHPESITFVVKRFIHDNFAANNTLTFVLGIILALIVIILFINKDHRQKIIFLIVWLSGGIIPYILTGTPSYYYSASASVSLTLIVSFAVYKVLIKNKIAGLLLVLAIILSNYYLISNYNPKGPNSDFVIQPGMLISKQKEVIDYIYSSSNNNRFAIGAITIPLNVNTTWSYLFEWYGQKKYGYLPTWGQDAAEGYRGNLNVVKDRAKLPETQFLILEPTIGIRETYLQNFFREESYFTKVLEEKQFGTIVVQKRQKI